MRRMLPHHHLFILPALCVTDTSSCLVSLQQHTRIKQRSCLSSFSSRVAFDPERQASRTLSHQTADPLLARFQALTSYVVFTVGVGVGAIAIPLAVVAAKQIASKSNSSSSSSSTTTTTTTNRSLEGGGSRTAMIALYSRAQACLFGYGTDFLAPQLLTHVLDREVGRGASVILRVCGWLSRCNHWLTKGIFEDQVAYGLTLGHTGLVTPLHCRTCWLDDCVQTFVEQHPIDGNVVLLGSGYDTRAYRLSQQLDHHSVYEVDAPGTLSAKRAVLQRSGIKPPANTYYVPCNLETTMEWWKLLPHWDPSRPTLILWEGVTMYLSEATIRQTLHSVAEQACANNWFIAFDYLNAAWASSRLWTSAMASVKEPFQFSVANDGPLESLVQESGLHLLEHLQLPKDGLSRYVPQQFPDHYRGILGTYGGFVVAGSEPPC